jgi:hypothetical protein
MFCGIRLCPAAPRANVNAQGPAQWVYLLHLVPHNPPDLVQVRFDDLEHQLVVHLQNHARTVF